MYFIYFITCFVHYRPFYFSYIIKGYRKAIDDYKQLKSEASDVEKEKLNKITQLVEVFDEASRCEEVPRLCSMIKEYSLAWEHCNQNHITRREVWLSLLPHMPIEAMVRNLSRMTKYGLFVENSEDEQMVELRFLSQQFFQFKLFMANCKNLGFLFQIDPYSMYVFI